MIHHALGASVKGGAMARGLTMPIDSQPYTSRLTSLTFADWQLRMAEVHYTGIAKVIGICQKFSRSNHASVCFGGTFEWEIEGMSWFELANF